MAPAAADIVILTRFEREAKIAAQLDPLPSSES